MPPISRRLLRALLIAMSGALPAIVLAATGSCNHAWDALDFVSSSGSASGSSNSSSGAGGGGEGPAARCGAADLLFWDLTTDGGPNGGPQSKLWELFGTTAAFAADGAAPAVRVAVESPDGGPPSGVQSLRYHDLRGGAVLARIAGLEAADAALELHYFDGHGPGPTPPSVFLCKKGADILCGSNAKSPAFPACSGNVVSSTPYDASEHLYLRISADEQGQISCSAWNGTSMVDGGPQWKPLGTLDKAAVPPPSSVQIAVVGGAGNFEIGDVGAQPGAAGPAKGARWCPVSALVDRFDDGIVPGPLWGTSNFGGGTADEDAGALTCHPDKALDSIEYLSSAAYDLTDGTLSIRLGSIPSGYVAQFGVRNDRAADYHDRSYTAHAELLVHSPDDGLKNAFAGCDAEGKPLPLPSWIRLRHRADAGASLLAFEYSDGGGAWTALTTCDTPGLDVSRVDVHLKATGPNGGTGTVVFDDCNAAP